MFCIMPVTQCPRVGYPQIVQTGQDMAFASLAASLAAVLAVGASSLLCSYTRLHKKHVTLSQGLYDRVLALTGPMGCSKAVIFLPFVRSACSSKKRSEHSTRLGIYLYLYIFERVPM
jgi:hypothetical protein